MPDIAKALEQAVAKEVKEAGRKSAQALKKVAREQFSGTDTPAELRRKDHPYATRHGSPLQDPAKVNKQTGRAYYAWQADPVEQTKDATTASTTNDDPVVAKFLAPGTKKMFARSFTKAIVDKATPIVLKIAQKAAQTIAGKFK